VIKTLQRKKIECYCPLRTTAKMWHNEEKLIEVPLFAGHIFIHIDESNFPLIKSIADIHNFLFWLNKPAIVSQSEITAVRLFLSLYSNVHIEKIKKNEQQEKMETEAAGSNVIDKLFFSGLGFCLVATSVNNNIDFTPGKYQLQTILAKVV
jgi:hypothetical protein